MAFRDRAPSFDIASMEPQNTPHLSSPAPAYSSSPKSSSGDGGGFHWQEEKHNAKTTSASSNTKNTHRYDEKAGFTSSSPTGNHFFPVIEEPHDPNHPLYAAASPPAHHDQPHPPPASRRFRLPQKRILIPSALALFFFLTTLWFVSIALGARFLSIVQPPVPQTLPEVHVIINGDIVVTAPETHTATTTTSEAAQKSKFPMTKPTPKPASEQPTGFITVKVVG